MNSTSRQLARRASVLILVAGAWLMPGLSAPAQTVRHLTVTQPGGMPSRPVLTGIDQGSNGVTVTWDGPAGYYQLFKKSMAPDAKWQPVGAPTLAKQAAVTDIQDNAFFKVLGPTPLYAGAAACRECHDPIYTTWVRTPHARALVLLTQAQQERNPACLPCHTVGYGSPGGFVSQATTPRLGGVQCENCHGPAANHAANENDPSVRPRVDLASTVCGGCHNGPQYPTYSEWTTSGHAQVARDVLVAMNSSPANLSGCGRCHSGSVRLSLLSGAALPGADANVAITCAVCHDPHQTNANPVQLRNPITSTTDYFLTPSASFSGSYDPRINLCAQCHNHRGASWTNSSAPPHPSPQYNMLLGTVGELASGARPSEPASHALLITNQCVGCHMQTEPFQGPNQPANTGHSFNVTTYEVCLACHPLPELLAEFTTGAISNQIQRVTGYLNSWASTKAPAQLWNRYGVRAWEYTQPGQLSSGGPGPNATEQALIPANIRKARFNLYLVLQDGSYGVHNGPFAVTLLETAEDWIQAELGN